jgi:hypothetical protein
MMTNFIQTQKKLLHLIHRRASAWTLISAARPGRAAVRASVNTRDVLVVVSSSEIEGPCLESSSSIAAVSHLTLERVGNGGRHGGYSHISMDSKAPEKAPTLTYDRFTWDPKSQHRDKSPNF